MTIDRAWLERELASVRAQRDQAAAVLQQATGAEKVFLALIQRIDEAGEPMSPEDIKVEEPVTTTIDPQSTERLVPRKAKGAKA